MEFTEVKLAARGARLHLQNEDCRIIIEKASPSFVFTTRAGIFKNEDGVECVFVPDERINVPLTDISKIEIPSTRFTPDIKTFIRIAW